MTEYEVRESVLLKVSPWKGVMRFGKKGKLAPRYVGPFEILERIGPVAYRLRLPEELIGVHDTFHVSNLNKCLGNANLHVSLNEIKIDKSLRFVEEPIEIMDRDVKTCVDIVWKLLVHQCALSLDKLAMPPHLHKKFRIGVAIAKGCKGYYKPGTRAWVRRGSRKIRILIDMYPCRVEERLTIKLVKGEEVLKIETTVTAKDGIITKFLRKFLEYKPTKEEEENFKLKAIWENMIYDISDSDSDLESMARSGPRDGEMEDTGGSGIRINA
ncbi:hypothetical protein Tco_0455675 [Tanacetum coccineum]